MSVNKRNKKIVIIKMESLFYAFIEDNFIGYVFTHYKFFYGLSILFFMIFNKKIFQEYLLNQLKNEKLINYLFLNKPIINYIHNLKQENKYYFILLSHHNIEIVEFFKKYFGYDEAIGNTTNFLSLNKLLKDNLSPSQIKKSIFITDSFDLQIIYKVKKIITTGSLIKILFNHYWNKSLINIYEPTSIHHEKLYCELMNLKPTLKWKYFSLNIKIITIEMAIILKIFFVKILLFIILMISIEIFFFPHKISTHSSILAIIETNNFINIFNLINTFKPQNYYNIEENPLFCNKVLKSFGSLRIGLFLFSFVGFLYLKNIFLLIIHLLFMGVFFKYPGGIVNKYWDYKIIFWVFNYLICSLFL